MLLFLVVVGLGPILWMLKSAITPTQDTLRQPMALLPNGFDLVAAVDGVERASTSTATSGTRSSSRSARGPSQIVLATTAGFALSVLRPRFSRLLMGLVLATLFVPPIVLLVPLYLTIVDVPIVHWRMINNYWAVWLPAGASAFNIVLVKRFFDNLPREIFEAARVDGAGPFRLFWSIVLPMSRPILGVVSVFALIATWKDYLWPLLVHPEPGPAAAVGPPADAPADDRPRDLHRGADHRDDLPDRAVPDLPAAVPARRGTLGRHQGLRRAGASLRRIDTAPRRPRHWTR